MKEQATYVAMLRSDLACLLCNIGEVSADTLNRYLDAENRALKNAQVGLLYYRKWRDALLGFSVSRCGSFANQANAYALALAVLGEEM